MKIAITGGTAGIGLSLGDLYEQSGHDVLRLSRRNGYNIRNTFKVADAVESCDMFINNAQSGFAQTELLFEIARRWKGTGKRIVSISSMMTLNPTCTLDGMNEYYIQKCALELANKELRGQLMGVRFTIVRPGNIATSPDKTVPPAKDVNKWCEFLFDALESNDFAISEISLG